MLNKVDRDIVHLELAERSHVFYISLSENKRTTNHLPTVSPQAK